MKSLMDKKSYAKWKLTEKFSDGPICPCLFCAGVHCKQAVASTTSYCGLESICTEFSTFLLRSIDQLSDRSMDRA